MHSMFVKNLCNIDVAVFCPDRGVYGWSWAMDMTLLGTLDNNGFIFDFSHAKNQAKEVVKHLVDHRLIIPTLCHGVQVFTYGNECQVIMNEKNGKTWTYHCPLQAVLEMQLPEITKGQVEKLIAKRLKEVFPQKVFEIEINLRDEDIVSPDLAFSYTHGLTQHEGQCQRIFHGHRSRLEVWQGQKRSPELEQKIWDDFLLGGSVHIAAESQIIKTENHLQEIALSYMGSKGRYHAVLPKDRVRVVSGTTSIEMIAQLVYEYLLFEYPPLEVDESLRVVVYEGIDKGASAPSRLLS